MQHHPGSGPARLGQIHPPQFLVRPTGATLRRLFKPEIDVLESLGNTARDWSLIQVADGFKGEGRDFGFATLIEVESQLGLKDQALDHFARYVAMLRSAEPKREVRVSWLLSYIFPKDEGAAAVWFEFLQKKFPEESPAAAPAPWWGRCSR